MTRIAHALCMLALFPLLAAEPQGFRLWPSSEVKDYGKKMAPKLNAQKLALEQLGTFGNHQIMAAYREATGLVEMHDKFADFFIASAGEATLVVGGTVVGAKTVGPGEVRGTSIQGGVTKRLLPGDVAYIPPRTPHHVKVEPGAKPFTWLIVKVEQ